MKFGWDRFAVSETTHSGDAKLPKFEDFYRNYQNLKIFIDITKIRRFLWILRKLEDFYGYYKNLKIFMAITKK